MRNARISAAAGLAAVALLLAACGGQSADSTSSADGSLSGAVVIDGSSTVAPLSEAAATLFRDVEAGVNVTVGTSGTGGGFEKFCAGETDISDASRPIEPDEVAICEANGISFTEIVMANDGLSVVVSKDNDWATCLSIEQLQTMWAPESEGVVTSWNQIDPSFPDEPLALFGAGTDSGTFDYFTEAVNGDGGAIRADFSPSEDDNVIVQGVAGTAGGVGFFGLSYAEENADILNIVDIDGGSGCVTPTVASVQDGSYTPLGRPLFIYVANASYTDKPQVRAFVDYYVDQANNIAELAIFVPLTSAQIETARASLAGLL